MEKLIKGLAEIYFRYTLILSLLLGFIFIVLGVSEITKIKWIDESFKIVGTTILSGGFFASIIKSSQFLDIFKDELREIVFCDENLSKRNDIQNIWNNVSKHLYKEKFPEINNKITETLKNYFPLNSEHYYENYKHIVDIKFHEEDPNFIWLDEVEEFTIKTDTLNEIEYKASCGFKYLFNDKYSNYSLESLTINGVEFKEKLNEFKTNKSDGKIFASIVHKLKGANKYKIIKKEKKCYSLKIENTKAHHARWLFNNYYLEVTYPKELEVMFYEIGTLNKFNVNFRENNGLKILKADSNYLILPNQGTRLIFKIHEKNGSYGS